MKHHYTIKKVLLFLCLGCLLSIASCKRETIYYPVPQANVWKPLDAIKYDDKNVIALKATGNGLIVSAINTIAFLNDSLQHIASYPTGYNTAAVSVPPHIGNKVAVFANNTQRNLINIVPLDNPAAAYSFDLKTVAPDITGVYIYLRNVPVCTNNANKLLVVCTKDSLVNNTLYPSGYMHLLFFDLVQNNGVWVPQFDKRVVYIKNNTVAYTQSWPPISRINTDGKDFYISLQGRYYETVRVTENGDVYSAFPMNIAYFLPSKDTTQILGFDANFDINWGYIVPNFSGYNVVNLGINNGGWMRFSMVNNRVIGYQQNQLFAFDLNRGTGQYKVTELENNGIEQLTSITGVELVGNTVVVGTVSGAYIKPLTQFFAPRK